MIHPDKKAQEHFQNLGSQRNNDNPSVVAVSSLSCEGIFYYATEYNPKTQLFYGYIRGSECDGYQAFGFDTLNQEELKQVCTHTFPEPQLIQSLVPELQVNHRIDQLQSIRSLSLFQEPKTHTL